MWAVHATALHQNSLRLISDRRLRHRPLGPVLRPRRETAEYHAPPFPFSFASCAVGSGAALDSIVRELRVGGAGGIHMQRRGYSRRVLSGKRGERDVVASMR